MRPTHGFVRMASGVAADRYPNLNFHRKISW